MPFSDFVFQLFENALEFVWTLARLPAAAVLLGQAASAVPLPLTFLFICSSCLSSAAGDAD